MTTQPDTIGITTEDVMSEGALSTSFRAARLLQEVAMETAPASPCAEASAVAHPAAPVRELACR